jgi:hypothetical protein
MILAGVATVAGLVVSDPWLRLGLLELGALLTIPLVWQSARTKVAKLTYLTVVGLSALSLVTSDVLMERGEPDWARALLLTSVCVKLAAVPLFFWLLSLADELPALVLGLIIAVVDMAAFGELYIVAQTSPGLLTPQGLLLGVAAATSFVAALLMLTQRSLKRLLVLSTIEDIGFLLLGLASANALGTSGVVFAALPQRSRVRGRARRRSHWAGDPLPGQRLRLPLRDAGHAGRAAHAWIHRPLEAL